MEYNKLGVFNKYLEIKKDLISNLFDLHNRVNYFTRKYRGDRFRDINVGIGLADNGEDKRVQIFVRYNGNYIKDIIIFNNKGLFESDIQTNLMNEY